MDKHKRALTREKVENKSKFTLESGLCMSA